MMKYDLGGGGADFQYDCTVVKLQGYNSNA